MFTFTLETLTMRRRYSRPATMKAKYAGTCTTCDKPIKVGQLIHYANKRAWHANCQAAALGDSICTACSGSGRRWNNANCPQCDGTGSKKVQEFAQAGGHDVDLLYEDDCARRCGL